MTNSIQPQFQITIVPETACLIMKKGDVLIDSKFYNKLNFNLVSQEDLKNDSIKMANKVIVEVVNSMCSYYRIMGAFLNDDVEKLLNLADFTNEETGKLINKFYECHKNTMNAYSALKQVKYSIE